MPEKAAKVRMSRGRPTAGVHFKLLKASARPVQRAAVRHICQRLSIRPTRSIGNRYKNPSGIAASIRQSAVAIRAINKPDCSSNDLVLSRNKLENMVVPGRLQGEAKIGRTPNP